MGRRERECRVLRKGRRPGTGEVGQDQLWLSAFASPAHEDDGLKGGSHSRCSTVNLGRPHLNFSEGCNGVAEKPATPDRVNAFHCRECGKSRSRSSPAKGSSQKYSQFCHEHHPTRTTTFRSSKSNPARYGFGVAPTPSSQNSPTRPARSHAKSPSVLHTLK